MAKKRIVVVCPGRGSYTRETSGYLKQFGDSAKPHISWMDNQRKTTGLLALSELDNAPFKSKIHMAGENASPLIYACSLSDFFSIDQNLYDIVAITGNSMGWYIALVLGGALKIKDGYNLIQEMGSMMKNGIIGGQLIYPFVDENWKFDMERKTMIYSQIKETGSFVSIELGGYIVIGGDQKSIDLLLKKLPTIKQYPFQIPLHAAFHTPLLTSVSEKAFQQFNLSLFKKPTIPLIDGRGKVWSPYSSNPKELMDYTLGEQVTNTFNFNHSITVAIKEYSPDKIFLLGPGNSLGGAVGQILVDNYWLGINSKKDFINRQNNDPYILSMGIPEQRINI